MTVCPPIEHVLAGSAAAHVAVCAGCKAILELSLARTLPPATCDDMEALLAARLVHELGSDDARRLHEHVAGCDSCRSLAQILAGAALADATGLGCDFAELGVVDSDNYVRGEEIGRGGMGR